MNMTQRAIGLAPLVTFIFTFLFSCAGEIQTKLIKGQGRFFPLNQLYSNTDLINPYLHIHASLRSVFNYIWPLWKQQGSVYVWKRVGNNQGDINVP